MPRSRVHARLPLLLVALLGSGLAPVGSSAAAPGPKTARERVRAVEIDIAGTGGVMTTEAEFLDGEGGKYRFGTGCGTAIAPPVLSRMFDALRDHALVSVSTRPGKAGALPCAVALTFYDR